MSTSRRRHPSPADLLDLADGMRPEADMPHLSECAACREQVIELRAVLEAARMDEVPEPSHLSWQQLETRVHDAVASEVRSTGPVQADASTRSRSKWWLAFPAAAGIGLAVFMARGVERRSPGATPAVDHAATPVVSATSPVAALSADDSSLSWMAELASSLDQEAIEGAGLTTSLGTADLAVAELSSDEQRELERLLRDELKRPGA